MDLILLVMHNFDIIFVMDWLATYHANVDYHGKTLTFNITNDKAFQFKCLIKSKHPCLISCIQAHRLLEKGCKWYLTHAIENKKE